MQGAGREDTIIRMRSFPISLVTLVIGSLPALAETASVLLPTGFDGSYAPEGLACAGSPRIVVKDGVMVGDEFSITVTDLVEDPVNPRKVEATLLNSGGGGEWEDSAVLTLTDDDASLVFAYPDGTRTIWAKCD